MTTIDDLFPLQARDRHIRRVLSGQEVPPGLEDFMRKSPILYNRIISREEANIDVYVEGTVIPPWQIYKGMIGDRDSWHNGLGEPVEFTDDGWRVSDDTRLNLQIRT